MTDIAILHLWRSSERFASNTFQMADQNRSLRTDQELFARSAGTMERFRIRLLNNNSTSQLTFTFQINGVIKQTIGPIPVGQVGVFLPALQLPLSFVKDDLLVIQLTGYSGPLSDIEWNCDLKFVDP